MTSAIEQGGFRLKFEKTFSNQEIRSEFELERFILLERISNRAGI